MLMQICIHSVLLILLVMHINGSTGDFRMWIGEDRNKVRNIVRPNVAEFEKLYQPFMGELVEMNHSGMMRKVGILHVKLDNFSSSSCQYKGSLMPRSMLERGVWFPVLS